MNESTKNIQELLEQAKWGKLSLKEIDYVVEKIKKISTQDDQLLYTLIHILGQSQAKKHRELLENFLYYPNDPNISKITLKTLCNYWDLTSDYLNEIFNFIKGVDWDVNEDLRLLAIGIAGEYLRTVLDKKLLNLLVELFDNLGYSKIIKDSEDRALIQSSAYQAISRAVGREYNEIPGISKILELFEQGKLDLSVIEQARIMLVK